MKVLLSALSDAEGHDPVEAFVHSPRARPEGMPWVSVNMVSSIDGATQLDGESKGLSGPVDRHVFHRLRDGADVVVAGATTVRADRYGPAKSDPETRARREALGRRPVARIAVVSGSLDLDWESPLMCEAQIPTLIAHPAAAQVPAAAKTASTAELVALGTDRTDLRALITELARRGDEMILVEGGPTIVGQLFAQGLVDEMYLVVSALVVGGDAPRITRGPEIDPPYPMELRAVLADPDFLFLRYERRRV